MSKEEYMKQLKSRLKRLPKEDFERAVEYYEEYFADAGEGNEAKAIEDLGSPREAADWIIRDMALDYSKGQVTDVKSGINALWVALLALFAAPIALPLLFAGVLLMLSALVMVWAILLALLLMAACAVIVGPFAVIAGFTVITKSIPVFISCVGIGLMSAGIGAALTYGMYVLCRKLMGWTLRGVAKMIRKEGGKNA